MIKLEPVLKDYLWGGERLKTLFGRKCDGIVAESWEASVHSDGESRVAGSDKTFSEYLKEAPGAVDKNGGEFPVLIKYIDAAKSLSVQVHPGDEYAKNTSATTARPKPGISSRQLRGQGFTAASSAT